MSKPSAVKAGEFYSQLVHRDPQAFFFTVVSLSVVAALRASCVVVACLERLALVDLVLAAKFIGCFHRASSLMVGGGAAYLALSSLARSGEI